MKVSAKGVAKYSCRFFKADEMLSKIDSGFVLIPFKLHARRLQ
jgi:hypothetical protein